MIKTKDLVSKPNLISILKRKKKELQPTPEFPFEIWTTLLKTSRFKF
jgi:hypothetical protein